jgi:hypothetical protein
MTNTIETATGPATVSVNKHGFLVVATPDFSVTLVARSYPRSAGDWRSYDAKVRVYGALSAFVPGFDERETQLVIEANRRDPDVKDPVLAAFQRRSIKDAKLKLVGVLPMIAEALRETGYPVVLPEFDEWKFSIKAGCNMCPCSPGFIGQGRMCVNGNPVDLSFN